MGTTLKNLPVKELSRLSSLKTFYFSDCGQAIDEPNLQILFEGLLSLEYLHLGRCSNLFALPDNINNLLSLSVLCLEGSSIESLPSTIKHLANLKSIELRDCKRIRSIPELPPSIMFLDATNCVSLGTVATSSSILQTGRKEYSFFFNNCVTLDEHSLNEDFVELSMKRAAYNKCRAINVCYAGSTVPEWFVYKQTRESCITIEIDPLSEA